MLIVISPAKTLDYETPPNIKAFSQPDYLDQSQLLIDKLRKQSANKLGKLMKISPALSELNKERYQQWQPPFDTDNAKQAVYAFKGDVYIGLEAESMGKKDIDWAQQHLRILSGLYGLLRPLDLMQPYRLEMGTSLKTRRGKNLYEFWNKRITDGLNQQLEEIDSNHLINLASNEYYKSVKPSHLNAEVITPSFLDWKNGEYKMIGFFAKKARGSMSAWIIRNRVNDINKLPEFDDDGYKIDEALSTPLKPVFTRKL
jgi:cytoplasmic iron level regulating protein YaaA (DUF328/UPF0246 family)